MTKTCFTCYWQLEILLVLWNLVMTLYCQCKEYKGKILTFKKHESPMSPYTWYGISCSFPSLFPPISLHPFVNYDYFNPFFGLAYCLVPLGLWNVAWLSCTLSLISICKLIHTMWLLLGLGYFTQDNIFSLYPFALQIMMSLTLIVVVNCIVFSSIQLCKWTTTSVFILWLRGFWVVPRFWLLQIEMLWT